MTGLIKCKIPEELKSPLFFSEEETELPPEGLQEWTIISGGPYFAYELLYWNDLVGYHPWEGSQKPIVEDLLRQWAGIKGKAGLMFSERKAKEAKGLMIEGLSLFFSILFWLQHQPVNLRSWKEHLGLFDFKPVNTEERLSFILARPALYHSYVQLGELFIELEKQYYKREIKLKKTPRLASLLQAKTEG